MQKKSKNHNFELFKSDLKSVEALPAAGEQAAKLLPDITIKKKAGQYA